MAIPVIVGSIIGGLTATISAIGTFMNNRIMAYFVVLAILFLDSTQASVFGNQGAVGGLLSWTISMLTGWNIVFESFQLMILFAIMPFLIWFLANTVRR